MGVTKTAFYTEDQIEMASILKALGHPARLAIMEHLIKVNTCICNDLVNEMQLAQPTISQHLKELKNAGLIKGNIEGASICYCINEKTFEQVRHFFANAVERYTRSSKKCC